MSLPLEEEKMLLDVDYVIATLNHANKMLGVKKEPFKMDDAFLDLLSNDIRTLVNEPDLNGFFLAQA